MQNQPKPQTWFGIEVIVQLETWHANVNPKLLKLKVGYNGHYVRAKFCGQWKESFGGFSKCRYYEVVKIRSGKLLVGTICNLGMLASRGALKCDSSLLTLHIVIVWMCHFIQFEQSRNLNFIWQPKEQQTNGHNFWRSPLWPFPSIHCQHIAQDYFKASLRWKGWPPALSNLGQYRIGVFRSRKHLIPDLNSGEELNTSYCLKKILE